MVIMLKGENGKTVAERVKARLDEIGASLPAGRDDRARSTTRPRSSTARRTPSRKNLLEGSLLVIVVLFVFLRDVRASLHRGRRDSAVDAGRLHRDAVLRRLGQPDVARRDRLRPHRRRRRRDDGELRAPPRRVPAGSPAEAEHGRAARACSRPPPTEVARPILFGVLIIVAVYLPIFTLEGLEGKMFQPMAITVCSALLGSLLLSLTAVPVAASFLLKLGGRRAREAVVRAPARVLRPPPRGADGPPAGARSASSLVAVTVAVGSLAFIGTEFMPKLDEGSILDRDAQAAVGVAGRVGRHLDARRADRDCALPRGAPGRDEDRAARPGDRGDGHLPGGHLRASSSPPTSGRAGARRTS